MTGRGASWSLGRHSLRRETAPIRTMGPSSLSPFGALLTEIVFPLVTPEALPPPASVTKAFFVGPGVIAPPRPPPPPPRAAAAPRIRPRPHAEVSAASAAPIET